MEGAVEHVRYEPGDRILEDDRLFEVVKEARTRWGSTTYQVRDLGGEGQKWLTPRRADRPAPYIDRESLRVLVDRFYGEVAKDPALGPVFDPRVGHDWPHHLAKMTRFWSMVMLREPGYSGAPPVVHRAIEELRPEHFQRWIALFAETLREVFEPELAERFARKVFDMSRGLSNAALGEPWTTTLGVAVS
jgi:hemoglobin